MTDYTNKRINELEARLVRIESRLVQLMMHVGADPYVKMYENLSTPAVVKKPIIHTQD